MARPAKTADAPDYRAKICEVAEALFAERGFDGASIREIAEQTGATKALIYHYYQSKEALYLSLLEKEVSEVVTQLELIAANPDSPEDKIRHVVAVFLGQFQSHPQGFLLVQRAIDDHAPAAHTLAERWFSRAHIAIQAIATEGVSQGVFKPLPPSSTPFVIVGILIHALRAHQLIDRITPGFSGPELLAGLADLLLTLLRTGESAASQQKPQHKKKKRLRAV